jgi:3-deoxy-D-manno-octulosonic-acid transferase
MLSRTEGRWDMRTSPSLWLYRAVVLLALPVVVPLLWIRDRITGKRRPPFRVRLAPRPPATQPGGLLIQAVSVGEVEVARRLVAELELRAPEVPVNLTATTATGLALARGTIGKRHPVLPCPLDLPCSVRRVLEAARPRALVLVETELWPELMHQARRAGIPVAVVNGRLSEGSLARYRRIGPVLRSLLEPLSLVLVRDEQDAARFSSLGVNQGRIRVAGNIKYDLEPDPTPLEWADTARALAGDRPIVVVGSTMEGEEAQVLGAVARISSSGRRVFTILAPRHPERFDGVADLLRREDVAFVRRSMLNGDQGPADILLLDTIGELARAYGLAAVAFIGGSLVPTGGHNPLEPAVWGTPVLSGHHVFNFQEVYDEMVSAGGARLVADEDDLVEALGRWLEDGDAARAAGAAARTVVERNRGATSFSVDALLELIDSGS